MATSLNGRLTRLEQVLVPTSTACCAVCGLPHVRLPIPLEVAEALVSQGLNGRDTPIQPLCLCLPCCTEGHEIARLTHGLPIFGVA